MVARIIWTHLAAPLSGDGTESRKITATATCFNRSTCCHWVVTGQRAQRLCVRSVKGSLNPRSPNIFIRSEVAPQAPPCGLWRLESPNKCSFGAGFLCSWCLPLCVLNRLNVCLTLDDRILKAFYSIECLHFHLRACCCPRMISSCSPKCQC